MERAPQSSPSGPVEGSQNVLDGFAENVSRLVENLAGPGVGIRSRLDDGHKDEDQGDHQQGGASGRYRLHHWTTVESSSSTNRCCWLFNLRLTHVGVRVRVVVKRFL